MKMLNNLRNKVLAKRRPAKANDAPVQLRVFVARSCTVWTVVITCDEDGKVLDGAIRVSGSEDAQSPGLKALNLSFQKHLEKWWARERLTGKVLPDFACNGGTDD